MRSSSIAICVTVLIHCILYTLATTASSPAHPFHANVVQVALPITPDAMRSHEENAPDIHPSLLSPENLIHSIENERSVNEDQYYLPSELSQQVHLLQDDALNLTIPIRKMVVMALYINETGAVDTILVEDKGMLTEEEEESLKSAFKNLIFFPGMRGGRFVKTLYRIQLAVNWKTSIRH